MSAQPSSSAPARKPLVLVLAAAISAASLGQIYDYAEPKIRYWEGTRHQPYYDLVGVLTVCQGHTGKYLVKDKTYTDAECSAILRSDMAEHFKPIQRCITHPLPIPTLAALLSGVINLGPSFVCGSNLQRLFNDGKIAQGCGQFMRWVHAGGRRVQGLVNRRADEYRLCMLGMLERSR